MKQIKAVIYSLIFISSVAIADEESSFDKAKDGVQKMWEKTKTTTSEIAGKATEKASEFGNKASEYGSKASKEAKETGVIVWDKLQEAGEATADSARKGASKIRSLAGQEDCKEDSALCDQNKE